MKIGDKVHCTAYAERIGQGISILNLSSFNKSFADNVWEKQVVYYDAEKSETAMILYSEFTDVTVEKFKIVEKEFDGIYVGTTRIATKLSATYETQPYGGDDYVRFESVCYKKFAVVYYANNRKRLVPMNCLKGGNGLSNIVAIVRTLYMVMFATATRKTG